MAIKDVLPRRLSLSGSDADVASTHPLALPESNDRAKSFRGWKALLLASGAYFLLSVFIWSNLWTNHPTSTTTCGCGDSSLFTWFIEWPAYAMAHGLSPIHSTFIHYPSGINLLANTSVLAIGVLLAPITWLFGPIATLNVALTLAPALSAIAMFILLRRWVSWAPAAFAGGLFYGFSPFIIVSLDDAHLMLGMAVVPPLIVACLDELLIRQRRRPVPTGVLLGLLIVLQFFIGVEMLLITGVMTVIGVVLIVVYAVLTRPEVLRRKARFALVGTSTGAVVAFALLAYPAWFALNGPNHLSAVVWAGSFKDLGTKSASLRDYVDPWSAHLTNLTQRESRRLGGYQGPVRSNEYFGYGVLAVVVGGLLIWRRDRRLWLFGAVALLSVLCSLGTSKRVPLPSRLFSHLPVVKDIVPYRFVVVVYFCVAVMLAIVVDRVYRVVDRSRESASVDLTGAASKTRWSRLPRWSGACAAVIVAAVALVPTASSLAGTIPLTTEPVAVPTWFKTVAPHLPAHQVLLVFPTPFMSFDNTMTWQAVAGMPYSMVGEGGPGGTLVYSGQEYPGAVVISWASRPTTPPEIVSAVAVSKVRRALREWKVTMVVIPDQRNLPIYDRVDSVTQDVALMTAVIGARPSYQAGAWVWTGVDHKAPSTHLSAAKTSECLRESHLAECEVLTGPPTACCRRLVVDALVTQGPRRGRS